MAEDNAGEGSLDGRTVSGIGGGGVFGGFGIQANEVGSNRMADVAEISGDSSRVCIFMDSTWRRYWEARIGI